MAASSGSGNSHHPSTVSFHVVREQEREEISQSRRHRRWRSGGGNQDGTLIGLALSGGGIRSATFNLGLLQGLANRGLLRAVDFLSTVSGGGYIGSWLSAWIRAASFDRVNEQLQTERQAKARDRDTVEAEPIRNLRRFSSYLTPRRGLLSLDSLTLVATYLRNLTLNLTVLVLALGALLLLPRLVTWLFRTFTLLNDKGLFHLAFWPLLWAVVFVAWNISALVRGVHQPCRPAGGGNPEPVQGGRARTWQVVVFAALPVTLAAWIFAAWLWQQKGIFQADHGTWAWYTAVLYGAIWLLAVLPVRIWRGWQRREEHKTVVHRRWQEVATDWLVVVLAAFAAGALAGPLLLEIGYWMSNSLWVYSAEGETTAGEFHAGIWGPMLVLLVFAVVAVVHVGLTGRGFHEEAREWWSRLGAVTLFIGLVWIVLAVIALYSPWWLKELKPVVRQWTDPGLITGWVTTSLLGVFGGSRNLQAAGKWGKWFWRPVVRIAPYVFVFGVLVLLACLLHWALPYVIKLISQIVQGATFGNASSVGVMTGLLGYSEVAGEVASNLTAMSEKSYWTQLATTTGPGLWAVLALLVLLTLLFAWRVGVNEFSLHAGYGNRLVRAYLGASNPNRVIHPFTGFDPGDSRCRLSELCPSNGHEGPYHLVNTALNLVQGRELAWQERKAASFLFSPAYCGSDGQILPADRANDDVGCYRPSTTYADGPALAKAMTISGAAASPNMGYYTSKPLAFLMTVFNVRLGWWLGNPCHRRGWRSANPAFGLGCLLSELLGMTNADSRYIYLSDGGHFENLGVYELVRRRCRVIVASDAACDGDFGFTDLANAIEKCRTDFGIDISINIQPIRAGLAHAAVGTIHYRRRDPSLSWDGVLVYVKASLLKGLPESQRQEPLDVRVYQAQEEAFPHETTADQWFSEKQFEAYRALGEHIAMQVFPAGPYTHAAQVVRMADDLQGAAAGRSKANRPKKTQPGTRA